MSERETAQQINDRATQWVARIDAAGGDPETRAELDTWLAGDERRQGAYFRAQAAWAMLDRASVLGAGEQEVDDEYSVTLPLTTGRRAFLWGASAVAASLVAGIGVSRWIGSGSGEEIETALGEIRRVPLNDGSIAAVNTATKVAIDMQPKLRSIRLDEGEVWFQVAKDRERPFVVAAGDIRVRAVGTAFSVRRLEMGADVQVTEGVVEVWSVSRPKDVRRIAAGARTFASDIEGAVAPVEASVEIDRSLAWRGGQIVFDGDTMASAAAEFNRYNMVKLEIDAALADEKVVGRFRTNEPQAFAKAASIMFGARAEVTGDRIVVSPN